MKLNVGIKNLKSGTNIMDIPVPEKLRERNPSGIDWLDDSLGGSGFTPGTVIMLTGTPGAGKSTMFLQMADALTAKGHVSLLNTGEESLYQTKIVAERLNLKHGFIAGQDILVPDVLEHCGLLMKTHLASSLTKSGQLKPGSKQLFLFIDSLQCMDDGKYPNGTNSMTPVRVVEMLTGWAKTTFANVIFIGQVTKGGEYEGKGTIKHAIDTHMELSIDTDKRSEFFGERIFTVSKNRFGCSGRTYVMGIRDGGLYERGRFHASDPEAV